VLRSSQEPGRGIEVRGRGNWRAQRNGKEFCNLRNRSSFDRALAHRRDQGDGGGSDYGASLSRIIQHSVSRDDFQTIRLCGRIETAFDGAPLEGAPRHRHAKP